MIVEWREIHKRIGKLPVGKCWGVPRGGEIIAHIRGNVARTINDCDFIIDDLIDSGKTLKEFREEYPNKPFYALFNKKQEKINEWIVFPWEKSDIKDSVTNILTYISEDPRRDGLLDTPKRVIKSWEHLYGGYKQDPKEILSTSFENDKGYNQMVVLKDIEFYSTCEHHLLMFWGRAKIGYIPKGKIVGISKLARVLEVFSRRLQVQERLTQQIAEAIQESLDPLGVGVVLEAQHSCMVVRGIQKQNSIMTTSCLLGSILNEQSAREEFMSL